MSRGNEVYVPSFHRCQVIGGGDLAVVDGDAGVLVGAGPALRGDEVLDGGGDWLPGIQVAGLEDDHRVPEDVVHGAVDVSFPVELSLGVSVEGVLVADD